MLNKIKEFLGYPTSMSTPAVILGEILIVVGLVIVIYAFVS